MPTTSSTSRNDPHAGRGPDRPANESARRCAPVEACQPFWSDYRELIERFEPGQIPDVAQLNGLLQPGTCSHSGAPIRFVPATRLPDVAYERHIYETGEVSTRRDNWHDVFNALVWCRLPRVKAALNALHYRHLKQENDGRRSPLRDALTLMDESGALVLAGKSEALQALAARDWNHAFCGLRSAWQSDLRMIFCGHGLLEKLLNPYKSLTAHTLLLQLGPPHARALQDVPLANIDSALARLLLDGSLLASPAQLSPLPLMGIPGWWPGGVQDRAFYADPAVFRPPPSDFDPAPITFL